MSYFLDSNGILGASPTSIRRQAGELSRVATHMDDVVRRLRSIQVDGVWESDAGRRFSASIGATPGDVEDIADLLHDAARTMRPYATRLEQSQRKMRSLDAEAEEADRIIKARDATLSTMSPDDPDRPRVQRERGEASRDLTAAERAFTRAGDAAYADEQRVGSALSTIALPQTDPSGYDWLESIERMGAGASKVGVLAKPLSVAGAGEPIGKAGRRLFYGEGSWKGVAKSGAGVAIDVGTLGIGRAAKGIRQKWGGLPSAPTKSANRVEGLPSRPRRIKDNPIATPAADARRAHRAVTGVGPSGWVTSKARSKSGMTDLEDAFDDWSDYAGAGNVAKTAVVVEHTTKQVNRVVSHARSGPAAAKNAGIDKRENARRERVAQRRHETVDRARKDSLSAPR